MVLKIFTPWRERWKDLSDPYTEVEKSAIRFRTRLIRLHPEKFRPKPQQNPAAKYRGFDLPGSSKEAVTLDDGVCRKITEHDWHEDEIRRTPFTIKRWRQTK